MQKYSTGEPKTAAQRLVKPFQDFMRVESSGGILLLIAALAAIIWANSPLQKSYLTLWQTELVVGLGGFVLQKPLLLWINDGLMAIFFFLVGLEIKREVLTGELSSFRQAALPIAAAIGGMIVPAAIYATINAGGEGASGWGIPMATDIAFALGILALLGSRAPVALKIFLTALAIVDDIGAVLVIAFFYTAKISWISLAIAVAFFVALLIMNRLGVRHSFPYILLGIGLWVGFLKSGVHATIAGILLAMTIPATRHIGITEFEDRIRAILAHLSGKRGDRKEETRGENEQIAIHALESSCREVEAPLYRMEHTLHPWVAFAIMPVFALANAGVILEGGLASQLSSPVSVGIILGLLIGKLSGVTFFSWLAVKTGLADLPAAVSWRQITGVSFLAGIGFTMSLFIAGLAFGVSPLLNVAKAGILAGSLISGITGWVLLRSAGADD